MKNMRELNYFIFTLQEDLDPLYITDFWTPTSRSYRSYKEDHNFQIQFHWGVCDYQWNNSTTYGNHFNKWLFVINCQMILLKLIKPYIKTNLTLIVLNKSCTLKIFSLDWNNFFLFFVVGFLSTAGMGYL